MEPLKICIEINLGEKTQETLKEALVSWAARAIALGGRKEDFLKFVGNPGETESESPKEPEKESESKPEPQEEPEKEPEDMPEEISDVTDEELINAVAETKKVVAAKEIRELFGKYGIPCSTKCPQEKRRSLIADLKALRDAQ